MLRGVDVELILAVQYLCTFVRTKPAGRQDCGINVDLVSMRLGPETIATKNTAMLRPCSWLIDWAELWINIFGVDKEVFEDFDLQFEGQVEEGKRHLVSNPFLWLMCRCCYIKCRDGMKVLS